MARSNIKGPVTVQIIENGIELMVTTNHRLNLASLRFRFTQRNSQNILRANMRARITNVSWR